MKTTVSPDVIAFIATTYIGSSADERYPMSQEDARYNIKEWRKEGVELPRGLDAWTLAHYWNEFCNE